jgi:hypothetical protein
MSHRTDEIEKEAMKAEFDNLTVRWNGKERTNVNLATASALIGKPMKEVARRLKDNGGIWRTMRFEIEAVT